MVVVHVVLFEFRSSAPPGMIKDACRRLLELANKCINPATEKPYIKMSWGGRDNSPEGLQFGSTHGFVVLFDSPKDRDYYVHKDPAHTEFKDSLTGIADVRVVDFEPAVF